MGSTSQGEALQDTHLKDLSFFTERLTFKIKFLINLELMLCDESLPSAFSDKLQKQFKSVTLRRRSRLVKKK